MKEKKNDLMSGIVFLVFAVFVYACSYQIKQTTSDILGSRFFPQVVAVLIAILAVVQIIASLRGMKKLQPQPKEEKIKKKELNKPLTLTTVALFAYFFVIQYVGFVITSIVYLMFQCYLLMDKAERKNRKTVVVMAVVAVAVPLLLNFVFWDLFKIRLPQGIFFK